MTQKLTKLRLGIDLGGTKIAGVVLDEQGHLVVEDRIPTPTDQPYPAIVATVAKFVESLEKAAGDRCSIGIGSPGSLDHHSQCMRNSNLIALNGKTFLLDLKTLLRREVRLANDANCFALSEAIDGAGAHGNMVFGIIMGTGVGGGLVINKRLHVGANAIAGEWGHMVLDPRGPQCYCGKRGCIETFLSGPALLRDYRHHCGEAAQSSIDVVLQAQQGEPIAQYAVARYLEYFAMALSQLINVLDPDVIVLGGGMSNLSLLYEQGIALLAHHVFGNAAASQIVRNRFGDHSGVRGAAWLWNETC